MNRRGDRLRDITNRHLAGHHEIERITPPTLDRDAGALVRDGRMPREVENFFAVHRLLHLGRVALRLASRMHLQIGGRDRQSHT